MKFNDRFYFLRRCLDEAVFRVRIKLDDVAFRIRLALGLDFQDLVNGTLDPELQARYEQAIADYARKHNIKLDD